MSDPTLGRRLREARLRHNLSQEALAEALGASVRSVRRWEADEAIPQPEHRARYCGVFGASLEELFGEDTAAAREPVPSTASDRRGGRARARLAFPGGRYWLVGICLIVLAAGGLGGLVLRIDPGSLPQRPAGDRRPDPAGAGSFISSGRGFTAVTGPGCPRGRSRGIAMTVTRDAWKSMAPGGWQRDGCDGSFQVNWVSGSQDSYDDTFTWWFQTELTGATPCSITVHVPAVSDVALIGGGSVPYEVLTGSDHHLAGTFTLTQRHHPGEWLPAGTFTATDGYLAVRVTDRSRGSHWVAADALSVHCQAV